MSGGGVWYLFSCIKIVLSYLDITQTAYYYRAWRYLQRVYGEGVRRAVVVGQQREGDVVGRRARRRVEAAARHLRLRSLRQQRAQPRRRHHQRRRERRLPHERSHIAIDIRLWGIPEHKVSVAKMSGKFKRPDGHNFFLLNFKFFNLFLKKMWSLSAGSYCLQNASLFFSLFLVFYCYSYNTQI